MREKENIKHNQRHVLEGKLEGKQEDTATQSATQSRHRNLSSSILPATVALASTEPACAHKQREISSACYKYHILELFDWCNVLVL